MNFSIGCTSCHYSEKIPAGEYPIPKARTKCPKCGKMSFPKMREKKKEDYCYADPFGLTSCNCPKCKGNK